MEVQSKYFHLLCFPKEVTFEIIKTMSIADILLLSACSDKMKNLVLDIAFRVHLWEWTVHSDGDVWLSIQLSNGRSTRIGITENAPSCAPMAVFLEEKTFPWDKRMLFMTVSHDDLLVHCHADTQTETANFMFEHLFQMFPPKHFSLKAVIRSSIICENWLLRLNIFEITSHIFLDVEVSFNRYILQKIRDELKFLLKYTVAKHLKLTGLGVIHRFDRDEPLFISPSNKMFVETNNVSITDYPGIFDLDCSVLKMTDCSFLFSSWNLFVLQWLKGAMPRLQWISVKMNGNEHPTKQLLHGLKAFTLDDVFIHVDLLPDRLWPMKVKCVRDDGQVALIYFAESTFEFRLQLDNDSFLRGTEMECDGRDAMQDWMKRDIRSGNSIRSLRDAVLTL